ncbi:membrane-associated protein, putative [Bodo saltans]|uniref:Membrane-associated protein, putative n=1 Tax=Bodo saltans TaxID=75058 RepID=A0A0S4J2D4_BODSA|nr:membrane-associated protein, putative [Bodo saltans]|eukprot:CUG61826.1 membrane-associated protein, putative [Bodo saltans]
MLGKHRLAQRNNVWRFTVLLIVFVVGVLVGVVVLSDNTEFVIDSPTTHPRVPTVAPSVVVAPTKRSTQTLVRQPSSNATAMEAADHVDIADDVDDMSWPFAPATQLAHSTLGAGTRYRCVSRGMQQKCLFENLVVKRNTFYVYDPYSTGSTAQGVAPPLKALLHRSRRCSTAQGVAPPLKALHVRKFSRQAQYILRVPYSTAQGVAGRFSSLLPVKAGGFPNPLYPPDGQVGPLIQNHKYRGHPVGKLTGLSDASPPCTRVIARPTIFVFRMSGHSTYHMWENNLGPFYATLLDTFDLETSTEQLALKNELLDPKKLLVSFVDKKPRTGPKAPKILDKLLRLFSDTPVLNASRLTEHTCFTTAIVGVSASRFPHRALVREGQRRLLGAEQSIILPEAPNMIYVSRNHKRITRGRKMINEADVYPVLNRTMFELVGKPVHKVFMEELSYKEQVQLASTTHLLFSPHGGGVANCIWMPPGAVVVEFVAPVGKTLPGMYHTMCGNSGVQHFHFLADADPNDASIKDNARLFSNLIMPVDRMIENAKKGLSKYQAARLRAQSNS